MPKATRYAAAARITLSIDEDLRAWIPWAASLEGETATAYINAAVRKDMDGAPDEVKAAFAAFLDARKALGKDDGSKGGE